MRTISPFVLVLLAASACNGSEPTPPEPTDTGTTKDTDVTVPTTEGPGFYAMTGGFGSIAIVETSRGIGLSGAYQISAMFADQQLPGIVTSAWCFIGGPCVPELPGEDAWVDSTTFPTPRELKEIDAYWAWVGNRIDVGRIPVHFRHNSRADFGYYVAEGPRNPDGSPVTLSFGGEFGPYREDVAIPPMMEITSPDPRQPLSLSGQIKFRWKAANEGKVMVRLKGGGVDRLYHLKDDGEYDLDLTQIQFTDASEVVVAMGRWIVQDLDQFGNTVQLITANMQPFVAGACESYPDVPLAAQTPYEPQPPYIDPNKVGMDFLAVLDNGGIQDYWHDTDADGQDEKFSAAVKFTVYRDAAKLCDVTYDASSYSYVGERTGTAGQEVFGAYNLRLKDGLSTCKALDPDVWGTVDIRDVIQTFTWGFGVGELTELRDDLELAFGNTWPQFEPLLAGGYVSRDGAFWTEANMVWLSQMEACGVVDSDNTRLPRPNNVPIPVGLYDGDHVITFDLK